MDRIRSVIALASVIIGACEPDEGDRPMHVSRPRSGTFNAVVERVIPVHERSHTETHPVAGAVVGGMVAGAPGAVVGAIVGNGMETRNDPSSGALATCYARFRVLGLGETHDLKFMGATMVNACASLKVGDCVVVTVAAPEYSVLASNVYWNEVRAHPSECVRHARTPK